MKLNSVKYEIVKKARNQASETTDNKLDVVEHQTVLFQVYDPVHDLVFLQAHTSVYLHTDDQINEW